MRCLNSPLVVLGLVAAFGLTSAPARADGPVEGAPGSRYIAALPFGAGQFQNGDVGLGIFFAAGEALLGGASITAFALVDRLSQTSLRSSNGLLPNIPALNNELALLTRLNQVAFAAGSALAVAGVIEAQVSFRSARCKRECAPVSATAAPVPGGGRLGVRVSF
jgi:hypothetical protein